MSHIHERMDFMLDLIVKGGTVVTASETFKADIGVEGEKISYIAAAGSRLEQDHHTWKHHAGLS